MIAWKILLKIIPRQIIEKTNETELSIDLHNGSEICLKGADNPDSLRGIGLHMAILDEYSSMKPFVWQEIVRPMLTDTRGKALFIGTPKGKNHFWELWLKGQKEEDSFKSWSFKTEDNPHIDKSEVEDARRQMNERYFRQEYEASFEDYTGLVWPEFSEKTHVVDYEYIKDHWRRISAIDPALTGTTAVLFAAINDDGEIVIYNEYYEQNKRVSEVSEALRSKGTVHNWIIDPASKIKNVPRLGDMYSLYDEYADNGIHADAGENDVDYGINRVAEFFKTNKIKITANCKNLLYELARYHWSEERETTLGVIKPKPYKSDDHLCDCLRYIVASRPKKAEKETQPVARGSVAAMMLEDEIEANDWRSKYQ